MKREIVENRDDYLEVYFRDETCDLKVLFNTVGTVKIEKGFLKIYDKVDKYWHCYNTNIISHYHLPSNSNGGL